MSEDRFRLPQPDINLVMEEVQSAVSECTDKYMLELINKRKTNNHDAYKGIVRGLAMSLVHWMQSYEMVNEGKTDEDDLVAYEVYDFLETAMKRLEEKND